MIIEETIIMCDGCGLEVRTRFKQDYTKRSLLFILLNGKGEDFWRQTFDGKLLCPSCRKKV